MEESDGSVVALLLWELRFLLHKSRLETHVRRHSPSGWVGPFWVNFTLVVRDAIFGISAVISCASVRHRIHSPSSTFFVVGSFCFLKEHEKRNE